MVLNIMTINIMAMIIMANTVQTMLVIPSIRVGVMKALRIIVS